MADRMTVNQKIQVGVESVAGTGVSAGKLLEMFTLMPSIEAETRSFTPTGFRYPTEQVEEKEWSGWDFGGNMDYNGLVYPISSIFGAATTTAHGMSTTAKDWSYAPPSTGATNGKTYTIEQGDSVRAHKNVFNFWSDWGYKITRSGSEFSTNGKLIAQLLQDGATLTSSPTAVALAPMAAKQVSIYLDTASGSLGTTQFPGTILSFDYSIQTANSVFWSIDRSKTSWTNRTDLAPKVTINMLVEADSNGMALLTYLQSQATYFLRVDAQGDIIATDDGNIHNAFKHDMAVKIAKPQPFTDDQGVFAIPFSMTLVHDATWNAAQKALLTNLITAL